MADLAIRNLTTTPLELKLVERFEGQPTITAGGGGGLYNATIGHLTSRVTGLFNSTSSSSASTATVSPKVQAVHGQEARDRREVSVTIGPFETRATDVRAPDPGREVIRLTFEVPAADDDDGKGGGGGGGAAHRRYQVDVPSSSQRSTVMRRLSSSESGSKPKTTPSEDQGKRENKKDKHGKAAADEEEEEEFTSIYILSGSTLAIFSSSRLSSWMGTLPDSVPLSCLSIPGTHNSPTCHVALPSVRCQAACVREQLDNGVRFFDVRVNVPDSPRTADLALVHSAFPIALTGPRYLGALLDDVHAFLDANPTETLIMSVKREGTGRGTDQRLSLLLKRLFYDPHSYSSSSSSSPPSPSSCEEEEVEEGEDNKDHRNRRWYTDPRIPLLGDVRGRIVLLRRHHNDASLDDEWDGRGWGLDGSAWPDNCEDGLVGSGIARVQDFYEVDQTTNIQKKIELARRHLERAAAAKLSSLASPSSSSTSSSSSSSSPSPSPLSSSGDDDGSHDNDSNNTKGIVIKTPHPHPQPFFINFLSASNFFNANCWPEKIAAKANPAIVEHLCLRHGDPGRRGSLGLGVGDAQTGVVVTDWCGLRGDWDLIRCVVGWNARLLLSSKER